MSDDKEALFDMDDVLVDYMGGLNRDLLSLDPKNVPINFDTPMNQELKIQLNLIKSQLGWWENLPPIKSGIDLMKLCKNIGFKIVISTQGPYLPEHRKGWAEKFNWCDQYVSPIDKDYSLIITRNGKGLVYGRVFVDDYPKFMDKWLINRPRGLGLMPQREWNTDFKHNQVIKYNPDANILENREVIQSLERAYSRQPGKNN